METFKRGLEMNTTYIPEEVELKKYFDDISKYDLLKRKEEEALFKTMHKWSNNMARCGQRTRINGKAARENLINSNLRLVIKIAKGYRNMGLSLSDLIAEGNMGLMRAVDKFKPNMKAKISTYASYWIKQCIFRAFDNKSRLIRVPSNASMKHRHVMKWIHEYEELTGDKPSIDEIATKFKTTKDRALSIMEAKQSVLSFDYVLQNEEGESRTFGETVGDDKPPPSKNAEESDNKRVLTSLINKLNNRERYILCNRFGLGNKKTQTLDKIGIKFNVSRERIRQVETIALRKLRRMIAREYKIDADSFVEEGHLITHF
jgi:RNA polymerase sigma factor (sigma-70 family)